MPSTNSKKVWPLRIAVSFAAALAIGGVMVAGDNNDDAGAPPAPRQGIFESADALEARTAPASGTVYESADALDARTAPASGTVFESADALEARYAPASGTVYESADALEARYDG